MNSYSKMMTVRDYLCLNIDRVLSLVANASTLFEIPQEVEMLLHEARRKLSVFDTGLRYYDSI